MRKALYEQRLEQMPKQAGQTGRDLPLKAASQIDAGTKSIKGGEKRDMSRENETKLTRKNEKARKAHASIAQTSHRQVRSATRLAGGAPKGVSLGDYVPPRGMSVFKAEPPVDAPSSARMAVDATDPKQKRRMTRFRARQEFCIRRRIKAVAGPRFPSPAQRAHHHDCENRQRDRGASLKSVRRYEKARAAADHCAERQPAGADNHAHADEKAERAKLYPLR